MNLAFPPYGLIAIKGKSGTGKSTLLAALSGLFKPQEGEVHYLGEPLYPFSRARKSAFHSKEAGFVFQHYNLLSGETAVDNVAFPLRVVGVSKRKAKKKALALLSRFGLEKLASSKTDVLSGGEKQRVALCRALIASPKVIFADEPTGALDSENARFVMETLKEESKKRLVLFVSHNEELIARYAERVITLSEKGIIDETCMKEQVYPEISPAKPKTSGRWRFHFLKKNIGRDSPKLFAGFLSGVLGFASLTMAVGFVVGNGPALEEEARKTLAYPLASLSKETKIEIPNSPLSLLRVERPEKEEADSFLGDDPNLILANDYSYFLPSAHGFAMNKEDCDPALFVPVFDSDLSDWGTDLLLEGNVPTQGNFREVLVNPSFVESYPHVRLGSELSFSVSCPIDIDGLTDDLNLTFSFEISGYVDEFSFLSQPTIYYSHVGLEAFLSSVYLPSLSEALGEEVNVPRLLELAEPDAYYAGYGYRVFAKGEAGVDALRVLLESQNESSELKLSSSAHTIAKSFDDLSDAFTLSLLLFVGIAVIALALILGMSAFSSFFARRKENAILMVLGAKKEHIGSVFMGEAVAVNVSSSLLALAISPFLSDALNRLMENQFGVAKLIRVPWSSFLGIPYLFPLLVLLASVIFGILFTAVPLAFSGGVDLAKELRDE